MRQIVYHKVQANDIDVRNPHSLIQADIQAFHVCREFLEALRHGTHKAIEDANQDLVPYFNYIREQFKNNKYYTF